MYIAYQTSRKLCTILADNHVISPENNKFYLYCFEFVLDNILFNAFLFLLGVLLSVPLQAVVYIITMIPMKMFAGGAHAGSRIKCSVISLSVFLLILYMTNRFAGAISPGTIHLVFFLSLALTVFMAPVDTRNKRIPANQRRQYKKNCFLCCLFVFAIYAVLQYYKCRECYFLTAICMMTVTLNQITGILINAHSEEEYHAKLKHSGMR